MRIIFMGTPHFACPTLEKLIADRNFEIVAVYTREPQIAGRGQKLSNSPIHDLALKHGLKVVTPTSLKNTETQKEFVDFKADAAVVVAYGLLLPQEILDATALGCFNIHPSLLPRWRGAAPIQRPLMAGDSETGVTIIRMDAGLDSGAMICQKKFALNRSDTYQIIAEKLSHLGAEMLVETLRNLQNNNITFIKQDEDLVTYAKKIDKSECEIDWNNSAIEILRKIHGLSGSLAACFTYKNEKIKIFTAEIIDENSTTNPVGTIDHNMAIQCNKGVIRPLILQKPGKKRMELKEFLLGVR